jgi:hypothetical protein
MGNNGIVHVALAPSVLHLRMQILGYIQATWPRHNAVWDHAHPPKGDVLVSVTAQVPGVGYPDKEQEIMDGIASEFNLSADAIDVRIYPDPDGPE